MSGPEPDLALKLRHQAAIQIIQEVDPDERPLILAAVVWPEDERLELEQDE